VLGHVDVRVAEVVVVTAGGLVPLVVEGTLLVFDVARGPGSHSHVALVVRAVDVVLLGNLPGQRLVVGQSRGGSGVVFRRSVLWDGNYINTEKY
jgi:hypothetical protein